MKKLSITLVFSSLFLFYSCPKKDFKVEPTHNVSTSEQINSGVSSVVSPDTIEGLKLHI
jgi:hypothetical protein